MTATRRSEATEFRRYNDVRKVAVMCVALLSATFVAYEFGISINVSSSLPIGFYRVDALVRRTARILPGHAIRRSSSLLKKSVFRESRCQLLQMALVSC